MTDAQATPRTNETAAPTEGLREASPAWESRSYGRGYRIAQIVAGCATIGIAAYFCGNIGFYRMFTGFSTYDDEGTALFTLANLANGHSLYDQVAATYGPMGFLPKLALVKSFSLLVTHDLGRFISLAYWWAAVGTFGLAVWRFTGSVLWFGIAAAATFVSLQGISIEPGHPQDMCALLLAAAVLLCTCNVVRCAWGLAAMGAVAGLLCMTKINLGLFCVAALWATIGFCLRPGRLRTVMLWCTLVGFAAGPFVLMRDSLGEQWARIYAFTITGSLLSCTIAALALKLGRTGGHAMPIWCLGGFAAAIVAIGLATMARGTSLAGLVRGVVLVPLDVSRTFRLPFTSMASRTPPLIGLSVTLLLWIMFYRWRGTRRRPVVGVLRICGGLAILCGILPGPFPLVRSIAGYAPWLMPLLLLPGGAERQEDESFPRMFLAFAALLESMWAYPVAGSQLLFSCTLLVTASCVVTADGIADLSERLRATSSRVWTRFAAAGVLLLIATLPLSILHQISREQYLQSVPLDLPGCDRIRVGWASADHFQFVVSELKVNADMLFCVPGLASYYLWTHVPPAALSSLADWMELFSRRQQQEVIDALRASKRPCILYDKTMLQFWLQGRSVDSPLLRYINEEFHPALKATRENPFRDRRALRVEDDLEIRVRRDRKTFVLTDGKGTRQQVVPVRHEPEIRHR